MCFDGQPGTNIGTSASSDVTSAWCGFPSASATASPKRIEGRLHEPHGGVSDGAVRLDQEHRWRRHDVEGAGDRIIVAFQQRAER